eukprot:6767080-Ditylum_brightwellii.AAC.1
MLYLLKRFIGQHRVSYIAMKEAADHVLFQLPIKFTRVGFLLTAIKCSDTGLQTAMANIKSDADVTSTTSKRHYFKLAAIYLLLFCHVFKKFQSGTKRNAIEISDTAASGFGPKPSAMISGVSLRYHTAEEYKSLIQPQKYELQEWPN